MPRLRSRYLLYLGTHSREDRPAQYAFGCHIQTKYLSLGQARCRGYETSAEPGQGHTYLEAMEGAPFPLGASTHSQHARVLSSRAERFPTTHGLNEQSSYTYKYFNSLAVYKVLPFATAWRTESGWPVS